MPKTKCLLIFHKRPQNFDKKAPGYHSTQQGSKALRSQMWPNATQRDITNKKSTKLLIIEQTRKKSIKKRK